MEENRPLSVKQVGRVHADKSGRIYSKPYKFEHPERIRKTNVRNYFEQYKNTNSTFILPVVLPNGQT